MSDRMLPCSVRSANVGRGGRFESGKCASAACDFIPIVIDGTNSDLSKPCFRLAREAVDGPAAEAVAPSGVALLAIELPCLAASTRKVNWAICLHTFSESTRY